MYLDVSLPSNWKELKIIIQNSNARQVNVCHSIIREECESVLKVASTFAPRQGYWYTNEGTQTWLAFDNVNHITYSAYEFNANQIKHYVSIWYK